MNQNIPDREELFDVPEEQKVIVKQHEKIKNTTLITLKKEGHTLGNLFRQKLLKNPNVLFVGYKQAHPLTHEIEIAITCPEKVKPFDQYQNCICELQGEITKMADLFKAEVENFRQQRPATQNYM